MSMKVLLGLGDLDLPDREIMSRFKHAQDHNMDTVEFLKADGTKVVLRMPRLDHSKYFDPWDWKHWEWSKTGGFDMLYQDNQGNILKPEQVYELSSKKIKELGVHLIFQE